MMLSNASCPHRLPIPGGQAAHLGEPHCCAVSPNAAWSFAIAALGLMGILLVMSSHRESVTFDEVIHLSSGISYWQTRDARLNLEHPLLGKLLAAMPVALVGVQPDYSSSHWRRPFADPGAAALAWGDDFFRTDPRADRALLAARGMMTAATLALGVVVFFWAERLWGPAAALLSVVLYMGQPFFLGYGPLVITDIVLPLFALLALWRFCEWLESPRPASAATAAMLIVAALASKYSAVLLGPVLLILWFIQRRHTSANLRSSPSLMKCTQLLLLTLGGWAAFQIYFGWFTPPQTLAVNAIHHAGVARLTTPVVALLNRHPRLAHWTIPVLLYPRGLLSVVAHADRPTVLLGHAFPHGTHWYFPIVFVLKSPPLLLVLLVLLAAVWAGPAALRSSLLPPARYRLHGLGLVLLAGFFTTAALASHLDIGIRHFSVPMTLAVLTAGALVPALERVAGRNGPRWVRCALVLCALGSIITAFQEFPDYISYRNVLAGSAPFYRLTGDSNLDWGQSLLQLRRVVQSRPGQRLWLYAYGSVPTHYIATAIPWRCAWPHPRPVGWVAISASRLNEELAHPRDRCAWLFRFPHCTVGNGTLYLFDLSPSTSLAPPAPLLPGGNNLQTTEFRAPRQRRKE